MKASNRWKGSRTDWASQQTILKDAIYAKQRKIYNAIGIERFGIQKNKNKAEADTNNARTISHTRSHKGAGPRGQTGESNARVNVAGSYNLDLARMSWAKLIKRERAQQRI
jgi:hypothetical protein